MNTNEKTANEIIWKLKEEKTYLLKNLEAANDLIEADTSMHAKDVEKSIELIKLAKENQRLRKDIDDVKQIARKVAANAAEVARENQRLRQIIRALLRDTNGPDKDTITSSIEIVSDEKKEVTK